MELTEDEASSLLTPEESAKIKIIHDMDQLTMAEREELSVRLHFPKFSRGFDIDDFDIFIQIHVGSENLIALGRLAFPNEWYMQLKTKELREKLIRLGKTKISNRTCWIFPLNNSEIRGIIRWIPTAFHNNEVENILKQFGDVLFIERLRHEAFTKIESDQRYFAMILRPGKTVEDIPNFTNIGGFTGLITIRGKLTFCFHCHEAGHFIENCPKYYEKRGSFYRREPKSEQTNAQVKGKRYKPSLVENESERCKTKIKRKRLYNLMAHPLLKDMNTDIQLSASESDVENVSSTEAIVSTEMTGEINMCDNEEVDVEKMCATNFENLKLSDSSINENSKS